MLILSSAWLQPEMCRHRQKFQPEQAVKGGFCEWRAALLPGVARFGDSVVGSGAVTQRRAVAEPEMMDVLDLGTGSRNGCPGSRIYVFWPIFHELPNTACREEKPERSGGFSFPLTGIILQLFD